MLSRTIPMADADVRYYPGWFSRNTADAYYSTLKSELCWRQDSIKLFGKRMQIPRLQAWYGDPHCHYAYSGLALTPLPFHPVLSSIRKKLEKELSAQFNCVLCNWYRDGQDSMSFHSDDEPELGDKPTIASITFGEKRNFDFKHKSTGEKCRLGLEHGSLLIMAGDTQKHYVHGINKTKRVTAPRINLTYRYITPHYER